MEKDPQARFWVEAEVALAKSAILLASAEASAAKGNFASAAVEAYYSLFHLSLALMWLLPESIPLKLQGELVIVRDGGDELPNRLNSHKAAERFLCDGQISIRVPDLGRAFREALALREFASYGPRVTYRGEQPSVGPCDSSPAKVRELIERLPALFTDAIKAATPKTAHKGRLSPIVVNGAIELLKDGQYPYKNWFAPAILKRGARFLQRLA
jgi:hypothetical protein